MWLARSRTCRNDGGRSAFGDGGHRFGKRRQSSFLARSRSVLPTASHCSLPPHKIKRLPGTHDALGPKRVPARMSMLIRYADTARWQTVAICDGAPATLTPKTAVFGGPKRWPGHGHPRTRWRVALNRPYPSLRRLFEGRPTVLEPPACSHTPLIGGEGQNRNCRHYDFQSYALPTELPRHGREITCPEGSDHSMRTRRARRPACLFSRQTPRRRGRGACPTRGGRAPRLSCKNFRIFLEELLRVLAALAGGARLHMRTTRRFFR